MKHKIHVEPDPQSSFLNNPSFRVVIRRKNGEEVGTPLKDVDEPTARAMLPALSSAFLCGVRSSKWIVSRAIDHIELNNAPDVAIVVKKTTP